MKTITAHILPAQGQSNDDVLAAVLGTQHERALIKDTHVRRLAGNVVRVMVKYDGGAGPAEYQDCADRIANMTGVLGVDSVRVH